MRKQRVLLGQVMLNGEPPMDLFVDLPIDTAAKKAAALKERLAYILDTRFQPSDPESSELTAEQVTKILRCTHLSLLRLIRSGKLHPVLGDDGGPRFDSTEVAAIRHVPISRVLLKLLPRG
jgi:hypothetical protein